MRVIVYGFLSVFLILIGCGPTILTPHVAEALPRDAGTQAIIATLSDQNLSLTEREKKYRTMLTAAQIGLAAVLEEKREEELAQARRIALWVSLASILGFVAGCVLLYLGSKVFGMVSLVASCALLIGCLAYASFIQYAGPFLAAILGCIVMASLAYEAWKHRAALFASADALPVTIKVAPPVARLIQKVRKTADDIRSQAESSIADTTRKVG